MLQETLLKIRENAQLVAQKLELEFDEKSVKFLEGFIERQREPMKEKGYDGLVSTLGSFLGECIIENFGGEWKETKEGDISISFGEKSAAYPFSKVRKQFENGLEDSIYSFYKIIPVIFKEK